MAAVNVHHDLVSKFHLASRCCQEAHQRNIRQNHDGVMMHLRFEGGLDPVSLLLILEGVELISDPAGQSPDQERCRHEAAECPQTDNSF